MCQGDGVRCAKKDANEMYLGQRRPVPPSACGCTLTGKPCDEG